ncbi:MAG: 16S rRNA (guanine(527)-N(7))-methyltransferase RsmG [bacterium]
MDHNYSLADFLETFPVSRETVRKLERFDALFLEWTARLNLVAQSTLANRWHRHYLDSAQLLRYLPEGEQLVLDLGSGGGFPGIFTALLCAERADYQFHLVESITKKCNFLREVKAELGLDTVTIHNQRIEQLILPKPASIVTARALARLDKLLALALPHCDARSVFLLHKGEKWQEELTKATTQWQMMAIPHESMTEPNARILEIRDIKRDQSR